MLDPKAKPIKEYLARARASLNRNSIARGVSAKILALEIIQRSRLVGPERFTVLALTNDVLKQIKSHPMIKKYLEEEYLVSPLTAYAQGKEDDLLVILRPMAEYFKDDESAEEEPEQKKQALPLEKYLEEGEKFLKQGNAGRARMCLRKAVEHYGETSEVPINVAQMLIKAGYHNDAAEILQQAMEKFPKENQLFSLILQAYTDGGQFAEAEKVYKSVIKKFGGHPKTYFGFAKLYMDWRKPEMAYDYLREALKLDPGFKEAKALLDKGEKKIFLSDFLK